MTKASWLKLLAWCPAVLLTACAFYRTVPIPVDESTLKEYQQTRKRWTIEDALHNSYNLSGVTIRHDSILGKISGRAQKDHLEKKVFVKSRNETSKNYLHLYTWSEDLGDSVRIPLSDISMATFHRGDVALTILGNAASIGLTVGFIVVIARAIGAILNPCGCPHVSVVDADSSRFLGSLFPGAIGKTLQRSDNLVIPEGSIFSENQVHFRISNDHQETQYIDRLELFEAADLQHQSLAVDERVGLISYDPEDNLLQAVTSTGRDDTDEISAPDGRLYRFDDDDSNDQFSRLFITIRKDRLERDPILVITAKQSHWMEYVAEFFFSQLGKKFDAWADRMDEIDPEAYRRTAIQSGIALNAYARYDQGWEYTGSFQNAGTEAIRTLALKLDLSRIEGPTLEIKLESSYNFWEVDYVGVTDAWTDDVHLIRLKTLSAKTNTGLDLLDKLNASDGEYGVLINEGDLVDVEFEAPANAFSNLILRASGYYRNHRDYTSRPNVRLLTALKKNQLTTHQLSHLLHDQIASASASDENN